MKKILFTLLSLVLSICAWASDTQVNGIWYDFDDTNFTATVTFHGDTYTSYANEYSGVVVIPASVTYNDQDYAVTSIGLSAFRNCSSLREIQFPNTLTTIGNSACRECMSLKSINIPSSVTSIGDAAFAKCPMIDSIHVEWDNPVYADGEYFKGKNSIIKRSNNSLLVGCSNTRIAQDVTSIGNMAFYGCNTLTTISIPSSVTSIGVSAFAFCTGLTHISIPSGVTSIGDMAYYGCTALSYITCNAANPPSCGTNCFTNVDKTIPVYVPVGHITSYQSAFVWSEFSNIIVKTSSYNIIKYAASEQLSINLNAFASDVRSHTFEDGIGTVRFYDTITVVGDYAFYNCKKMTAITLPNTIKEIGYAAFQDCDSLSSIILPDSVTSIGGYAFSGCTSLTSFEIPDGVTNIGEGAFSGCVALTSIDLPNALTTIEDGAFSGCTGLTSLTIPSTVVDILGNPFSGCSGLCSIAVEEGNNVYDSRNSCNAIIHTNTNTLVCGFKSSVIPDDIREIRDFAFLMCAELFSVMLPNTVERIGAHAFGECTGLSSIVIPSRATEIGEFAFANCLGLSSVVFSDSIRIKKISESCFSGCESLSNITLPDQIDSIDDYAFALCSSLTSITIPSSVKWIGSGAFYECQNISDYYFEGETPAQLGETSPFYGRSDMHIPCQATKAYEQAWGYYGFQEPTVPYVINLGIQVTETDITAHGTVRSAYTCASDTAIITATPERGYCFIRWEDGNTDNPRSIVMTQDTAIGAIFGPAYSGQCGENAYWSYSDGVLNIVGYGEILHSDDYTFWLALTDSIVSINISEGITSIGEEVFYEIQNLTSVIIPKSVTNISYMSFAFCENLNALTILSPTLSIGEGAFCECKKLSHITCYATNPPSAYPNSFANYNVFLRVPCDNLMAYQTDAVFGSFKYIQCIEAELSDVTTVIVNASETEATFAWPTTYSAMSYVLTITKDGVVFCTLTFNANGQLSNIAFAPSRNNVARSEQAMETTTGYQFTVTGLDGESAYTYTLEAKGEDESVLAIYSGSFSTGVVTGTNTVSTGIEPQKFLHEGKILLKCDENIYNIMGTRIL